MVGPWTVLRFARLLWRDSDMGVELFHVARGESHYLLEWLLGGSGLSYDVKASGDSNVVSRAFDLALDNYEKGTAGNIATGYKVVSEQLDSKASKHLQVFDHPSFGVDWSKYEPENEEDMEARDFFNILDRQLRDWLGSSKMEFRALRHPYWPTYREQVRTAIKRAHGGKIRLYRGVFGKQAREVMDGQDLALNPLSSWSLSREYAKDFVLGTPGGAGGGRSKDWVVIAADFRPKDVIFAPVVVPEFGPDPNLLLNTFGSEEEFIIHNRKGRMPANKIRTPFKTRRKRRAQKLARRFLAGFPSIAPPWVEDERPSEDETP